MGSFPKTFIFLDLEATGLNADRPKITELCLIAVHASSLKDPVVDNSGEPQLPRVLDKLCLCVDPGKPLSQKASEITGLTNELLTCNEKQMFDVNIFNVISDFVSRQAQPVCLVAHNGFFYDFPLIKTELQQQQHDLSSSMLCLDSLQAFRHLSNHSVDGSGYVKGQLSLPEIYRRFFGREPSFSHFAEGDVLTLIMVFLCKADQLLKVATYKKWGEITPMY
ncbi:three prime repair exonuclease 2 [Gastrophryne carolinensis]